MKKLFLLGAITVFSLISLNAQTETRFGATAGYLNASSRVDSFGIEATASEAGFYGGLVVEFGISDQFKIQPELLYANAGDVSFLQVPIYGKYYVSEKFFISGGPTITYTLEEVLDDFTKFNFGLGLGLGYDFTEAFFIETRGALQINNYFTGSDDITSRINFINIGIGYKFN